jgi:hypothetical protein
MAGVSGREIPESFTGLWVAAVLVVGRLPRGEPSGEAGDDGGVRGWLSRRSSRSNTPGWGWAEQSRLKRVLVAVNSSTP